MGARAARLSKVISLVLSACCRTVSGFLSDVLAQFEQPCALTCVERGQPLLQSLIDQAMQEPSRQQQETLQRFYDHVGTVLLSGKGHGNAHDSPVGS